MTKLAKLAFALSAILVLAWQDVSWAKQADFELRSQDADLDLRIGEVELDVFGPRVQDCQIERIYKIYAYQTCFILMANQNEPERSDFQFVYHGPRPIVSFSGWREGSYYFEDSALGRILAVVTNANDEIAILRRTKID